MGKDRKQSRSKKRKPSPKAPDAPKAHARKAASGAARRGGSPGVIAEMRIGHGYDIHRLQRGGRLMLGGVVVAEELSAVAHSDGDVVIHALVDAICGAAGWGDIGELFPNSDPQWKDAASSVFLLDVCERLRAAHLRVQNADITILAEKPKLLPFKPRMTETLGAMLGPGSTVNIKAGTNEGCDAVGRGEAIAAHAAVLLVPASER